MGAATGAAIITGAAVGAAVRGDIIMEAMGAGMAGAADIETVGSVTVGADAENIV